MIHSARALENKIAMKLENPNLSPEKKEEIKQLNDKIKGDLNLVGRKLLLSVLDNNKDKFMNILESLEELNTEDKLVVEQIIEFYEEFVVSCIVKDDYNQLTTILYYCDVSSKFFAGIFSIISCIGYNECLSAALEKIEKNTNICMEEEPLKTLFDANFYRRIVLRDDDFLIKELLAHKNIPWNKELMKNIAQERGYNKAVACFDDSSMHQDDRREQLNQNDKTALINKIKDAVKKADVLQLEECLQDLSEKREKYGNLENILNQSVKNEDGNWKRETLMHWACYQGDLLICKALYKSGAKLRVLNTNCHTPAHLAIEANHLHVLKWLHSCDPHLIEDFFGYGWIFPSLKKTFLFQLSNDNVRILDYLVVDLRYDQLMPAENINNLLEDAIVNSNGNYNCIDSLLKGKTIRNNITANHLEKAASYDDKLLSRLLKVIPKERFEEIIIRIDKKFFKQWNWRCPEALQKIFSDFVGPIESGKWGITELSENGKKLLTEASKIKSLPDDSIIAKYIEYNLISMLPYFIDVFFILIHLVAMSMYCISYGMKNGNNGESPTSGRYWLFLIMWWILLVISIMLLVKQAIELYIVGCKNFLNPRDVVETSTYILSLILVVLFRISLLESCKLIIIIGCLFLSWINFFVKLMVIPWTIGQYLEMFNSILKTFCRVLLMFAMFILCFSTAFYTLFHKAEPFKSFHSIVGKTLAMITGEFDFNDLFFPDPETQDSATTLHYMDASGSLRSITISNSLVTNSSRDSSPSITHQHTAFLDTMEYPSIIAYWVFFVFCICLHILLLNLLVGLAVDDISKLREDSKGHQRRKQAELIADLVIFWRSVEDFYAWIKYGRCHEPDVELGMTRRALNEAEPLVEGFTLQSSPERSTALKELRQFSEGKYAKMLFLRMGLYAPWTKVPEEAAEMHEDFNKQRQEEHEETTKKLNFMQDVMLEMHNQNRSLMKVINNMEQRMIKMEEEMNKQSK